MPLHIAFLYIAEPYQIYHNASVAFDLARRDDCTVEMFCSDPDTPQHVERIREALGGPAVKIHLLKRSFPLRAVQSLRVLGFWKEQVMRENAGDLERFDAVICSEGTDAYLRKAGLKRPLLIYMPHGAGDRKVGFLPETRDFEFVTPLGEKCASRMLHEGLITEGRYAIPGYIKFEVTAKLGHNQKPLFDTNRPIALYNPHRAPQFSSWPRFIEPILEYFGSQDRYNLVVAPHVKMFHRMPQSVRDEWQRRSTPGILIDTGSLACLDQTYTNAATLYLGDVSSQVYEYLVAPKPCVFLNARKVDWRNDPNYAHWHMGDVVEDPQDLPAAIASAPARHAQYRDLQVKQVASSLGDISPGATARAADAIYEYLKRVRA